MLSKKGAAIHCKLWQKCDMKLFLLFLTTFSFAHFFPQNESSAGVMLHG